ncbi:hypothetical protein BX592_110134 [Paraburkholderia rhizosphaerae]|uniref:Uncharacterized protein n=1 Tax=Paraburkholderia rhizosphaerae TaxID=480658 RepID=A0A4V3HER1_9BURK|nr:hypothetical protein BX592_110134 [Paraburkholderia rhizosphaerae]
MPEAGKAAGMAIFNAYRVDGVYAVDAVDVWESRLIG